MSALLQYGYLKLQRSMKTMSCSARCYQCRDVQKDLLGVSGISASGAWY